MTAPLPSGKIKHIISQLVACKASFEICGIHSEDELNALLQYLRLNSPVLFHLGDIRYSGALLPDTFSIYPRYILQPAQYFQAVERIKKVIEHHKEKVTTYTSQLDVELYIHDLICSTVTYEDIGEVSHTIIGPLFEMRGVCDGISKTAKLLLQNSQIEAFVINGRAAHQQGQEPHAWNLVKIENDWCHLDVTFDLNTQKRGPRYDYFNLDTGSILADHFIDFDYYGISSSCRTLQHNYFRTRGTVINSISKLKSYFQKQLQTHTSFFTFMCNISQRSDREGEWIDATFQSVAKAFPTPLAYEYSYNHTQRVMAYRITY